LDKRLRSKDDGTELSARAKETVGSMFTPTMAESMTNDLISRFLPMAPEKLEIWYASFTPRVLCVSFMEFHVVEKMHTSAYKHTLASSTLP
jgi:hypothetical protein